MFEVNIYLETSMKGPGTRKGWYAAVIEYHTKKHGTQTREVFRQETEITYHKSVLLGFLEALKILNKECILTVYTDSVYLVSSFNNHLNRWEQNGYKNAKDEAIKNQSEWKQITMLRKQHEIQFAYTKRHCYSSWISSEAEKRLKTVENSVENTENSASKGEEQKGEH